MASISIIAPPLISIWQFISRLPSSVGNRLSSRAPKARS
jgi:hypothetical protein